MVKESYIYVAGRGLVYMSVSEARLCCFKHHLDDQPLFQIAISDVMNLNGKRLIRNPRQIKAAIIKQRNDD